MPSDGNSSPGELIKRQLFYFIQIEFKNGKESNKNLLQKENSIRNIKSSKMVHIQKKKTIFHWDLWFKNK